LQLEVPPLGLAPDGDADEVGGLIVQAVGHVKVRLGERVALIEVDCRLAADRLIGRSDVLGGYGARSSRDPRPLMRPGLLHDERVVMFRGCRTNRGRIAW